MLLSRASAPSMPDQAAVLRGSRFDSSQGGGGAVKCNLSTCGATDSGHGQKTKKRGGTGGSCESSDDSE